MLEVEPLYVNSMESNIYGFPKPLRSLILGTSGSGKTTFVLNIILKKWVFYTRIVIFTKTKYQKCYTDLEKICEDPELRIMIGSNDYKPITIYTELKDIDEIEGNDVLVIFDDMLLDNQSVIGKYFMLGRHRNFHMIFIAQNFGKVNTQFIKANINHLVIFKQPVNYLEKIWHVFGREFSKEEFISKCLNEFKKSFGFVKIDLI